MHDEFWRLNAEITEHLERLQNADLDQDGTEAMDATLRQLASLNKRLAENAARLTQHHWSAKPEDTILMRIAKRIRAVLAQDDHRRNPS